MKSVACASLFISVAAAASTVDAARAASDGGAQATIEATAGNHAAGVLAMSQTADGVRVSGTIRGLSPDSSHGFHVHETGDCSAPDASSAGGHFAPELNEHGNPAHPPHHAGDMPNIGADAKGLAKVDIVVKGVNLEDGPNSVIGRAVVVHERADDYTSQPSGDSGARIGCGVISRKD